MFMLLIMAQVLCGSSSVLANVTIGQKVIFTVKQEIYRVKK